MELQQLRSVLFLSNVYDRSTGWFQVLAISQFWRPCNLNLQGGKGQLTEVKGESIGKKYGSLSTCNLEQLGWLEYMWTWIILPKLISSFNI